MADYKYIIIGNSAGGMGAVESIREIDKDGSILIISDEEYYAYSRPLISYYLADKIKFEDIFYREANFYPKNKISLLLGKRVKNIDFNKKLVWVDKKRITYDKLLIASGGIPFIPKIKGIGKNLEGIFTFTKISDAINIKKKIEEEKIKKVVILGGGLIGLKAAEALIEKGLKVIVVELMDRILGPVFDKTASYLMEKFLSSRGIKFITSHTISEVKGTKSGKINKIVLDNGEVIDCKLLIIAIGVKPQVDFINNSKLKINKGIIVDKFMKTSVSNVYSCGDVAENFDFIYQEFRLTPLWPTAYYGGRIAGFNITGEKFEYHWGCGMNSVDFWGFSGISFGIINPDENYQVLTYLDEEKNIYKKIVLKEKNIYGCILINNIDRGGIYLHLARNKIDISSFKDFLLSDDFGFVYLPKDLRNKIIREEVK